MNESDPRSNVHYLGSSENKAWKKMQACTGFESITSAIPVQRSSNWANKPTGSWSWCILLDASKDVQLEWFLKVWPQHM